MRKFGIFTWILMFFLVIGFLSALRYNFFQIIIPIIIFSIIFYFYKHPNKLNFAKNNGSNNNYKNNQYSKSERKNSFTVIDGNFKENKKENSEDKL